MPGFIEKYCCRRYRLAAHALQTRTIPSALAPDRLNHVFGKKKSAPPPPFHTRTPLGAGPTSSQASMTTFCERDHVYFDRILEFNLVRHPKVCIISILFLDLNKKGRKKKTSSQFDVRHRTFGNAVVPATQRFQTHVFPLGTALAASSANGAAQST